MPHPFASYSGSSSFPGGAANLAPRTTPEGEMPRERRLTALHVIQSVPASSGGTTTAFIELVESLRTTPDTVVHVLTERPAADDPTMRVIREHPHELWTFSGPIGRLLPADMYRAGMALLDRVAPDVVHVHGLWNPDAVVLAREARRRRIATVWQPHGMLARSALQIKPVRKKLFLALGLRHALTQAGSVVFCSRGEVEAASLGSAGLSGPEDRRAAVVPLPVNMPCERAEIEGLRASGRSMVAGLAGECGGRGGPVVAFLGRVHPVKRLELAIDALAHARRSCADMRLLVIGDGEPGYVAGLRERAAGRGLTEAVVWSGWADGARKWSLLAGADALVFCSQFENFGYALVEALAVGTPVVATRNLALAGPMQGAVAGLACEETAESVGEALAGLATSPANSTMGGNGRQWVESMFSRQAVGRQLRALYSNLGK